MLGRRPRSALEGLLGLVWASALVVTAGCGDDMPTSNPGGSTGASGGAGGGGGDGGTIHGGCPPGAKPDGGTCLEPGVPEGACGDGFTWEAGGCTPILPALPCPSGQIARPGETACHPLADCGRAPWGNIPVETDTVYVDASFVGTSDGSESNPYTSLEFGMNSASAGQLVAVAAGTYVEDIDIQKPVRIWGRCPDLVKVVGVVDEELSTIIIGPGADGSEIRGLSIEGPEVGLALSGAEDVLFENLWIHDTGHFGIFITRDLGDTAYTLRGMLVENAVQGGIRVFGARGVVEDTVVRDIAPLADGTDGEGITATEDDLGTPELTVRRSVVERTSDAGILLSGGELVVEDSVVRDIEPSPAEQIRGRGIAVQYSLVHEAPAVGEIRRTVVSDAHEYGIFVWSSEALVEHVTVRQVDAPSVDLLIANGIAAIHAPAAVEGAQLTLRQSLSERNGQTGVHVSGSDAVIEQVLVRDSLSLFGQRFGR
ncbi:MAG: right-handed parallel beta-helix repeat-containing protein, partial [Polyangiaceae bacterium]